MPPESSVDARSTADPLLTTRYVKEGIVSVCERYLERVGCNVRKEASGDYVTLRIHIPPDPPDRIGQLALAAQKKSPA